VAVGDEIVCSASGHAFALPAHPRLPALLRRLGSPTRIRVADVIARYSGTARRAGVEFTASPRDVRSLLERLLSLGALTIGP
jgi:hypothetical protein